jgi:hypothetical protein
MIIFLVLFILGVGFLAGMALRERPRALRLAERLMHASIYFFLFVLGLLVGSDAETLSHLDSIGFKSFLIALAGVGGSLIAAGIMSRFFLKDDHIEE